MRISAKIVQMGVILFFIAGYFFTSTFVAGEESVYYGLLSLINIVAFMVLAACLGKPKIAHAPIWLMLYSILVAYFLQFYIVLYDPRVAGYDLMIDDYVSNPDIVLKYLETVTLGFCSFCLGSILSILVVQKKLSTNLVSYYSNRYFINLTAIILILSLSSGFVMAFFGTSAMGGEQVVLPYRLTGLVFYLRTTIIPALLIYAIWIADTNQRSKLFVIFFVLLVMHGISDMLMRSSRGFLLQIVLMATMLFVMAETLNDRRVRVLGWTIFFTILVLPIIGFSREIRKYEGGGTIYALTESINSMVYDLATFFETSVNVIFFLLVRFTGAVSFLQIMARDFDFVLDRLFEPGFDVTEYMTYEVMEWPIEETMGYAPSTFGHFYLIGGGTGLALGIFLFIISVMAFWSLICRLKLRARPVVMAIFLAWFFVNMSDGTWSNFIFRFFLLCLGMILCEVLARIKFGNQKRPNFSMSQSIK